MRDEIVALEDEADAVVAVSVPVAVFEIFGGDAVDDEVAGGVFVEATDDIEQSGLAGAGGAEDAGKFAIAKSQRDAI